MGRHCSRRQGWGHGTERHEGPHLDTRAKLSVFQVGFGVLQALAGSGSEGPIF